MTDGWNEQEQRQFTRIAQGLQRAGLSIEDAERHAYETVEAMRLRPRKPLPDPSNPTKDQLYREAMRYDIAGRSKMDKAELLQAVEGHRVANRGGH